MGRGSLRGRRGFAGNRVTAFRAAFPPPTALLRLRAAFLPQSSLKQQPLARSCPPEPVPGPFLSTARLPAPGINAHGNLARVRLRGSRTVRPEGSGDLRFWGTPACL